MVKKLGAVYILFLCFLVGGVAAWVSNQGAAETTTETVGGPCTLKGIHPDNPPEAVRAISLVQQRLENNPRGVGDDVLQILPCIVASFDASLENSNTEGYFSYNFTEAGTDFYPIHLNPRHQEADILLNSLLIVHEATHVAQYVKELETQERLSCWDSEVGAFKNEVYLIKLMTKEEQMSVLTRIVGYKKSNAARTGTDFEATFTELSDSLQALAKIDETCRKSLSPAVSNAEVFLCLDGKMNQYLNARIRQSGYYQSQCGVE